MFKGELLATLYFDSWTHITRHPDFGGILSFFEHRYHLVIASPDY